MKKKLSILCMLCLSISLISGCGKKTDEETNTQETNQESVEEANTEDGFESQMEYSDNINSTEGLQIEYASGNNYDSSVLLTDELWPELGRYMILDVNTPFTLACDSYWYDVMIPASTKVFPEDLPNQIRGTVPGCSYAFSTNIVAYNESSISLLLKDWYYNNFIEGVGIAENSMNLGTVQVGDKLCYYSKVNAILLAEYPEWTENKFVLCIPLGFGDCYAWVDAVSGYGYDGTLDDIDALANYLCGLIVPENAQEVTTEVPIEQPQEQIPVEQPQEEVQTEEIQFETPEE